MEIDTFIPQKRIAELEDKVNILIWLHAEMSYNTRMAAVKQMLSNPAIQERLKEAFAAQLQAALT
jgi:hypothetical protein